MRENFCPNCGTENESEYSYCKNCGTALANEKAEQSTPPQQTNISPENEIPTPAYTAQTNQNTEYTGCINEISQEEMHLFVGKGADHILPRFIKMDSSNSKVSWCWPAAILGFVLGPIGLSIWYFYRKMYKPAWLLTIAAAIYAIFDSIATLRFENVFDSFESILNGENIVEFLPDYLLFYAYSMLDMAICAGFAVLGGLFSYYLYKNHCISKIREFKSTYSNAGLYKFGLATIGGTSGGMLAAGIAIAVGINTTAELIVGLISNLF